MLNYDEEEDNDTDKNVEEVQGPPEEEDNDVDEDEEEAQGPPVEENDGVDEPPAVENNADADNDDDNNNAVAEADMQQPVEVEQPGDPANLGDADDDDEVNLPEIQGVDEEAINPETPGVGMAGENGEDKDEEEAIDQPPLVPPQRNDRANRRYNLRNSRGRDCDHRYARKDFIIDSMAMTTRRTSEVLEMPQMSLKVGLQTFGNDGVRAVEKEMCQLHDRSMMMPVHKKSLTPEQQKEALAYLMFLK